MNQQRFAGDRIDPISLKDRIGVPAIIAGGGAIAGHGLTHDDMDYVVEEYKDFDRAFRSLQPEAQKAYVAITSRPKMSPLDRIMVNMAFDGEIEKPLPNPKSEGDIAINMALQLKSQNPELAQVVRDLNQIEIDLIAKEIGEGTNPREVIQAAEDGAGVSGIPALIGTGVGAGAGMYAMRPGRRV